MTVGDHETENGVLLEQQLKVVIRILVQSVLDHAQRRLLALAFISDLIVIIRVEQRWKEGFEVVVESRLIFHSKIDGRRLLLRGGHVLGWILFLLKLALDNVYKNRNLFGVEVRFFAALSMNIIGMLIEFPDIVSPNLSENSFNHNVLSLWGLEVTQL